VPMNYQFRIRRNPIPNVGPETKTDCGHIGLWKNGCSIYNPKDAKIYQDSSVWLQNAWYWEHLIGETFDPCTEHHNGSGQYHTHVSPNCLNDIKGSMQVIPLIGYAFGGYPIYGGYGYSNPLTTNSTIKRLKSSYRLRNISDRTKLPDGTVLPMSKYGPTIGPHSPSPNQPNNAPLAASLGAYMEDYEDVVDLGDLDIHNGIFAYFTTLDWVTDTFGTGIKPVFPYVIGTAYYGEVYPTDGNTGPNSGFVVISEPVTPYVYATTSINEIEENININLFPNPTSNQLNFKVGCADNSKVYVGTIYNNNGTLIQQKEVIPNQLNAYDAAALPNGIYYFIIQTNKRIYSTKFIITK